MKQLFLLSIRDLGVNQEWRRGLQPDDAVADGRPLQSLRFGAAEPFRKLKAAAGQFPSPQTNKAPSR